MRRGKGYRKSKKKSRNPKTNMKEPPITSPQDMPYFNNINNSLRFSDEYDLSELEDILRKLLGEETTKNETLEEQVNRCNVYKEYNAMTPKLNRLTNYDKARYLILQGIIKMVKFDPINGDKPNITTDDEQLYWDDLEHDIKEGGRLLYEEGGNSNICGLRDDLVWSFVPRSIRHKISMLFDDISF